MIDSTSSLIPSTASAFMSKFESLADKDTFSIQTAFTREAHKQQYAALLEQFESDGQTYHLARL